eukprot:XP_001709010.1 Hypothetical protein GL50803_38903 [Giardia lamblia ATCC 50803]
MQYVSYKDRRSSVLVQVCNGRYQIRFRKISPERIYGDSRNL